MTVTGERRIEGLELKLPGGWVLLPPAAERHEGWPQHLAHHVVLAAAVEEAKADGNGGRGAADDEEVIDLLAGQFEDVAAAADELADPRLHVAVLVRDPGTAIVDAMLTLASHASISPDEYVGGIAAATESSDEYLLAREIIAEVPAGSVRGAHLMLGHHSPDDDGEGAALEERVVLGVFPDACPDMVEVVVIAHGVTAFADLPAEVIGVLTGLRVTLGADA